MFTHRAFYVWYRNFTVYRSFLRPSLVSNIGEPLLHLFAMGYGIGFFITEIEGMPYINYITPGVVVIGVMYAAAFELTFGAYTRMTAQRTYDSILATPVSIEDLVAGEIFWGATKSLISTVVVLVVLSLFGLYTPGWTTPLLIIVMGLTGLVIGAGALVFSAKAPDYMFFNYFFTIVLTPMLLLSGAFFPVDRFPDAFRLFAQTLPMTHSVGLARSLFYGTPNDWWIASVIYLALLTWMFWWYALRLVRARVVS